MKYKTLALGMSISVLTGALILALLPPGIAAAIPQATPTVKPFGDFVIPTATPGTGGGFTIPTATPASGGGFVIPTATPGSGGGFVIPTSTPAAPAGPSLPVLDDAGLEALNLQPGDVPGSFAANKQTATYTLDAMIQTIRDAGANDLADIVEQTGATYGWNNSMAVTYTSCEPSVPISEIYSEVGQLASPDAARGYFSDPQVEQIFTALGYSITPATNVHGWRAVLAPEPGVCFAQETGYYLFFEYWGLWISVSMTADANTDPALVNGLLDQLAGVIVTKANALSSEPFPPTPVPGSAAVIVPTQAAEPTLPAIAPPTQSTTTTSGGATLTDLEGAVPTQDEIGLPAEYFSLNASLSTTQTLAQVVAGIQALGLAELASATQQTGQRDGLIGTVIRVWDTGSACPETVGLSVEVDISLFQTAQGALTNMNDATLQQAWINTGVINTFQNQGSDAVLASGLFQHQCGTVQYFNKLVAHGRFVVAVSAIGNQGADQQTLLTAIDQLNAYTIQKIDAAGLE